MGNLFPGSFQKECNRESFTWILLKGAVTLHFFKAGVRRRVHLCPYRVRKDRQGKRLKLFEPPSV